jgi:beta-phosphoglucomutase-like phosphatase (HAD superfamily)
MARRSGVRLTQALGALCGSWVHTGGVARPVDLDTLIERWRASFEAARSALRSAEPDLAPTELRQRAQHLASEQTDTVRLLEAFARDRSERSSLVRLVVSPWEVRRLLALPSDVAACVFNVDGVLVGSAAIHAEAWKQTFDELDYRRIEETGEAFAGFSVDVDYPSYVHGKTRAEAIRTFLASRGLSIPDGGRDDPPGWTTVHALAARKNEILLGLLQSGEVRAFAGARLYLALAHVGGILCGVVSASTNTRALLDSARLGPLVADLVDGNTMAVEGLQRKPAPDMLLAACRHLGVPPGRAAVFETGPDGVVAGNAAGCPMVVAVDQGGDAKELRAKGADLVVSDLGALLEKQLGS